MGNFIFFILGLIFGVISVFLVCAVIVSAEADERLNERK